METDRVLELMKCPLTGQLMKNPVVTYDEICYERDAIDEIFIRGDTTDPTTGKPFLSRNYILLPLLREIIQEYLKKNKKNSNNINEDSNQIVNSLIQENSKLNDRIIWLENELVKEKSKAINKEDNYDFDDSFSVFGNENKDIIKNDNNNKEIELYRKLSNAQNDIIELQKQNKKLELEISSLNTIIKEKDLQYSLLNIALEAFLVNNQNDQIKPKPIPEIKPENVPIRNVNNISNLNPIKNPKKIDIKSNTNETKEDIEKFKSMTLKEYIDKNQINSSVEEMKIIVKYNNLCYIQFVDDEKRNAISYSIIKKCSLNIIKYLISLSIDVMAVDNYNCSALYYACKYGTNDIVTYLIILGLKVSSLDDESTTPLHIACRYNNLHVVKTVYNQYMMETKCNLADLNKLKNLEGYTILHFGAFNSKEVIEFLSEKVNINIKNKYGRTALHLACANNPDIDSINELLSKGGSTSIKENDGLTPISFGIKYNKNSEVVEYLNCLLL